VDIPYSEVTPGDRIRNAVSEAGLKVSEHPTLLSSGYLTANVGPDPDYKDLRMQACIFADWDIHCCGLIPRCTKPRQRAGSSE